MSDSSMCPVCNQTISISLINQHLDSCLALHSNKEVLDMKRVSQTSTSGGTESKQARIGTSSTVHPFFKSKSIVDDKTSQESSITIDDDDKPLDRTPSKHQLLKSRDFLPLAEQLRPNSFTLFEGQLQAVGTGTVLRRLIENDNIPSMILWGPPGCGKTTLAHIIASRCKSKNAKSTFVKLSAVMAGTKDVKDVVERARNDQKLFKKKTILFIDEVHRFNKLQQDVFLPFVESGVITLIGATTENPSFALNSALLSRCKVFVLDKLDNEQIRRILLRALDTLNVSISDGYDRKGDQHYDTISAYIKSMRGGDHNAALYYLARMLGGGEDPRFVARRLIIFASEDIGMADSAALPLAVSTHTSVEKVGMPEARIMLAHCTVYCARAAKSRETYEAFGRAEEFVKNFDGAAPPVPIHLRNAPTRLMKELGYGKKESGRHYSYLPDQISDVDFFKTT